MNIIPNDRLSLDMFPGPEATEEEFFVFALTFNGYEALPGPVDANRRCGYQA